MAASDIDELLEDLRAQRKALSGRKSEPAIDRLYYVDRWIAAVEKLLDNRPCNLE